MIATMNAQRGSDEATRQFARSARSRTTIAILFLAIFFHFVLAPRAAAAGGQSQEGSSQRSAPKPQQPRMTARADVPSVGSHEVARPTCLGKQPVESGSKGLSRNDSSSWSSPEADAEPDDKANSEAMKYKLRLSQESAKDEVPPQGLSCERRSAKDSEKGQPNSDLRSTPILLPELTPPSSGDTK
jgi:hypothetical protein